METSQQENENLVFNQILYPVSLMYIVISTQYKVIKI